ncbi:MAG: GNAT family N-acetyltransferase [Geodermatophilaceae bacterium]|nr:GNAT family N-acetyltransferase [Geodermatophilaceae bacterium]MDQ3465093.1 GNAT family N-acetyltransferase [Actinomycetota bacterium]
MHRRDARLVRWEPAEFVARVRDAMTIYAEAMGYSASVVDNRIGYATAHADRPGFRAVAALDRDGVLLGFGYGYTSAPGQWWHDQVRRAVDRDVAAQWLPGSVELCELHVRPDRQGAGLGCAILLTLLEDAPHPAVLLSTPEGQTRAWRLYRSLGFVDLARQHLFPGDARPFAVLGARLPLTVQSTVDDA